MRRTIYKSVGRVRNEAHEVLANMFGAELLLPSDCIWIVSPWLSNIPVVDNSTGAYRSLVPNLPQVELRLLNVLEHLGESGTHLVVATRPVRHNLLFCGQLRQKVKPGQLCIVERELLHRKGILTQHFLLMGSMNITQNGVEFLEETLHLTTHRSEIAEARLEFRNQYGGRSD